MKHVISAQLAPQIHEGEMKYYWRIEQHINGNVYCIADGWAQNYMQGQIHANRKAHELGLR